MIHLLAFLSAYSNGYNNLLCSCHQVFVSQDLIKSYCPEIMKLAFTFVMEFVSPYLSASECRTPCANGGTCVQGSCICLNDYVGGFCQNISKSAALILEIPSEPPRITLI